jgi:hypothetical protein
MARVKDLETAIAGALDFLDGSNVPEEKQHPDDYWCPYCGRSGPENVPCQFCTGDTAPEEG